MILSSSRLFLAVLLTIVAAGVGGEESEFIVFFEPTDQRDQTVSWTVAWAAEGHEVETASLSRQNPSVFLKHGTGCLVAAAENRLHIQYFEEDNQPKTLRIPTGERGALVEGQLVDSDGIPISGVAMVDFVNGPTYEWTEDVSAACTVALKGAGVFRAQTDSAGSFTLGPLFPGRFGFAFSSDGHASKKIEMGIGKRDLGTNLHVGRLSLKEAGTLRIQVDLGEMYEELPMELVLERWNPKALFGKNEWKLQSTHTIENEEDTEIKGLAPGEYRLRISDEEISFVQHLEVTQGEQSFSYHQDRFMCLER